MRRISVPFSDSQFTSGADSGTMVLRMSISFNWRRNSFGGTVLSALVFGFALLWAFSRGYFTTEACGGFVTCLYADVYSTPEKVLAEAFPGASVERFPFYITTAEKSVLEKELGAELPGRFFTFYRARKGGEVVGFGTFDTHKVRTKEQTIFVAVNAAGAVQRVETISFFEPEEYRAPQRWLDLFNGKTAGDPARPGVDLPVTTGATLTAGAVSRTVRRVLVLHRLLKGKSS